MKRQLLFLGMAAAAFTAAAIPPTVQGVPYRSARLATADYEEPGPIPASEFDMNTIQFWAGEGSKKCAIVIQWCDPTEEAALVFGYNAITNITFQGTVPPVCAANTFYLAPDDMVLHVPAEAIDAEAAEVEYYTLDGIRVAKTGKGIYLQRKRQ